VSVDRKPVVVVGSINMDLVANAEAIPVKGETVLGSGFQTHPGGKGANQAVAVARLGYPVRMIGRLGDDGFGRELRLALQVAGVDVGGMMVSPGSSGVALIVVSRAGENCIVVVPGANALLTPQDLDAQIDIIRSAGIVLVQLEIPLETVERLAEICAAEGIPLILDPAPARELPASLLGRATWFTPNEMEAAFYLGGVEAGEPESVAQTLRDKGVDGLVLKLGSRGAWADGGAEAAALVRPFKVNAVDTTAAGDAFNGAFATGLMLGKPPAEAARFASAAAAVSVTRAGAQGSMATMEEAETMMMRDPAHDQL
jgi:ribokinase